MLKISKIKNLPSVYFKPTIFRTLSAQPQPQHKYVDNEPDWKDALPYSKIPGPTKLELIRAFLPGGKYKDLGLYEMQKALQTEYGNLVKLPGLLGKQDVVFTSDPIHVEKVFRTEGIWPVRRGIKAFTYYRMKVRPDIFKDMGGLVSDQGESWLNLRTIANPVMLQPKTVNSYIPVVDEVATDFIKKIKILRNAKDEMPDDFGNELNQWALESIGTIALDQRLGIMSFEKTPDGQKLIKCVKDFFELAYDIETKPPVWYYYETKNFKLLMEAFDGITDVTQKYVNSAIERIENEKKSGIEKNEHSVLEKLLAINKDYAVIMAFDMLFAGVDTTSSASATLLYNLAKNPDKQEKLREEIFKILPNVDSTLKPESLNNIPYFKACMKESMRIQPVVGGNIRATGKDIVLQGYQVPADVDVAMNLQLMLRDEKNFSNNREFIPERWLRQQPGTPVCPHQAEVKAQNPFVFLPFGFGPRTCIGKRFAEMEIEVLVARLLREFKVEWNYEPIEYNRALVFSPSSNLKYKFTNIN